MDPSVWSQQLGESVRRHRQHAGLSQVELARLAGVGKTVVFDVEKGKPTVRVATLLRILEVLNLKLTWVSPLQDVTDA